MEGEREAISEVTNDDIDVIFEEGRDDDTSDTDKFINLIAAPFTIGFLVTYLLTLNLLQRIVPSDKGMQDDIASKTKADVVKVDYPLHRLITQARYQWFIVNYGSAVPFFLVLSGSGNAAALVLTLSLACVVSALAFVAGTATSRDFAMVMNMDRVAREEEYEIGVLVVGGGHEDSIRYLVRKYSDAIVLLE